MAYGIVYRIFNTKNGKSYVGQTVRSLNERWTEHLSCVKTSKRPIYAVMRLYGVESFVVMKVVEASSQEELDAAELCFGDLFEALVPNGYCLKLGKGNGRHCDEAKEKIREGRKRQGYSGPRLGTGTVYVHTVTCLCGKVLEKQYEGRKYCSQKCRTFYDHDRMVERGRKSCLVGAAAKAKRVLDKETGKVYVSARSASRETGIDWNRFRKFLAKQERFFYIEKKGE